MFKVFWRKVKTEYAKEREGINSKESFSATGYFFARELYKKLKIPIGIIGSSWGGTRVEAWTSPKKLKQIYSENLELLSGIDLSYKEYENEIKSCKSVKMTHKHHFCHLGPI